MPIEIQNVMSIVLASVGALVVGGGGLSVITYGLFRFVGEKWLNAKFEERLAAYKHAQQRELEHLKFEINALMDRTTKLHQREFDVLPEAWGRLTDAHGITTSLISAVQQYPNINRMNESQMEEFLLNSELSGWQKEELQQSSDKTKYYIKAIFWHRTSKAKTSCQEFHVYLLKNGIFIPNQMKSKFSDLDDIIYAALTEYELNELEEIRPRMREAYNDLGDRGRKLLKALEEDVQGRLWKSEIAAAPTPSGALV